MTKPGIVFAVFSACALSAQATLADDTLEGLDTTMIVLDERDDLKQELADIDGPDDEDVEDDGYVYFADDEESAEVADDEEYVEEEFDEEAYAAAAANEFDRDAVFEEDELEREDDFEDGDDIDNDIERE